MATTIKNGVISRRKTSKKKSRDARKRTEDVINRLNKQLDIYAKRHGLPDCYAAGKKLGIPPRWRDTTTKQISGFLGMVENLNLKEGRNGNDRNS